MAGVQLSHAFSTMVRGRSIIRHLAFPLAAFRVDCFARGKSDSYAYQDGRQKYKTADDAISDIQANINKAALLKQRSSSKTDSLAASKLLSDLHRATNIDC